MATEVTIDGQNFESEVLKSDIPVIADFWADWCVPCKMIAPILEELSDTYDGKFKVAKINVDNEPDLAMHFGVVSIPTLILFKDGEVANKQVGAGSKSTIESLFKDHV